MIDARILIRVVVIVMMIKLKKITIQVIMIIIHITQITTTTTTTTATVKAEVTRKFTPENFCSNFRRFFFGIKKMRYLL